jgi:hypothetical protein
LNYRFTILSFILIKKKKLLFFALLSICFQSKAQTASSNIAGAAQLLNKTDDGYRGIWYFIGDIGGEYQYKYAGGLGTYPSNHYPFSVYVPKVNKTFFCYGGTDQDGKTLYHEVSYFDHATGKVPKPTIVLDKKTIDAHENPVMQVDKDGFIWLFSPTHGAAKTSLIHRSSRPYDISDFQNVYPTRKLNGKEVALNNFSYPQIYYSDSSGFIMLFSRYTMQHLKYGNRNCRIIAYMTSLDGIHWSESTDIANIEEGHYQTSGQLGKKIGTSFNYHPAQQHGSGLDFRTNLYYLSTEDFGKTWQNAEGKNILLPLTTISNEALVQDYEPEGLKVYINDLNFDKKGRPVILYETTKGWEPGPTNGPREWFTAHFNGKNWNIFPFTVSDNNYDMGSIFIEKDGTWRVIAPTGPGPQPYNTGGSIVMWTSRDEGRHWQKVRELTPGCELNQSYPRRPVNANPGFYAFWADGNGRKPSKSNLYFSDKNGNVFMLPATMNKSLMKPQHVFKNK